MTPPRPATDRPSTARTGLVTLGFVLLALALLRIAHLVAHDPLAGYANQYDMLRTSACIGWWPALSEAERVAAHPAAPIERYVRGPTRPDTCYPSTEVVLAAIGFALGTALAAGPDGSVPLAAVGLLKALLLAAALLALQWRLRRHPGAALTHALLAMLLAADPLNTLWLNTLYTEFGALLGAWLALGGLALRALGPGRAGAGLVPLLGGLALLGASRVQHLLLGPALLLIWLLLERGRTAPRRWPLVAGALLCGLAALMHFDTQRRFELQAGGNRINALFGAIVPASADAPALLARLGLPAQCIELAHVTWYLRRGRDAAAECPEALALGHHHIALALLAEPATLARVHARALLQSAAWRVPYVGELAGRKAARVEPGPYALASSLAGAIALLPPLPYLMLWLVPWLAAALAWPRLALAPRRVGAGDVVLVASGTLSALVLSTAVMGDGYSELARHAHLGANLALVGWVALLARALGQARAEPRVAATHGLLPLAGAGAIALALLQQPLAFGVLSEPAGERVAPGRVALAGWVLDAGPPAAVEALLADGTRVALALAPALDVAPYYPVGAVRRYAGELTLPAGSAVVPLAIVVRRDGIETVIDRRWLAPAPAPTP